MFNILRMFYWEPPILNTFSLVKLRNKLLYRYWKYMRLIHCVIVTVS